MYGACCSALGTSFAGPLGLGQLSLRKLCAHRGLQRQKLPCHNTRMAQAAAKAFAAQLDAARGTLQSALGSTTVSEDSVQSALNDYLALLHGLVDAPGGAAAGADPAAADGSGAAAPAVVAEGLRGNSPMRRAVSFAWADALVTGALHTYPDALFELGSVLVAAAVWYMRRAAGMCKDTASGIATGPATQVGAPAQMGCRPAVDCCTCSATALPCHCTYLTG